MRFIGISVVTVCMGWPGLASASAFELPNHDVAVGPALAYAHGPDSGFALGLDTAYTESILAASLNLKYVREGGYHLYGAQTEFSIWFLANWGVGVGYLTGSESGPVYHLFAGFPFGDEHTFFEPYYRLNFFVPDGLELLHEVGLMYKYTTYRI